MIVTSVILPLVISALNLAPIPSPTTSNVGAELYSLPPNCISIAVIDPLVVPIPIALLVIIGLSAASFPFLMVIVGFFSRFKTVLPYPVPPSYT